MVDTMTQAVVAHSPSDFHPDTMEFLNHAVSSINQSLIGGMEGIKSLAAAAVKGLEKSGVNGAQIASQASVAIQSAAVSVKGTTTQLAK